MKTNPFAVIIVVIVTLFAMSGGVYLWMRMDSFIASRGESQTVIPEESGRLLPITKELLVSGQWAESYDNPLNRHIEFYQDGTFVQTAALEVESLSISGSFRIEDNTVVLKNEKYGDFPFEEENEKRGLKMSLERKLFLIETDVDLFSTRYLTQSKKFGIVDFWDKSAPVPEGSIRRFDRYDVVITHQAFNLREGAVAREFPNVLSGVYTFGCVDSCERGDQFELSDVFNGVVARTQMKEIIDGKEYYWYLISVVSPSNPVIELGDNKNIQTVLAWVHGSELE